MTGPSCCGTTPILVTAPSWLTGRLLVAEQYHRRQWRWERRFALARRRTSRRLSRSRARPGNTATLDADTLCWFREADYAGMKRLRSGFLNPVIVVQGFVEITLVIIDSPASLL